MTITTRSQFQQTSGLISILNSIRKTTTLKQFDVMLKEYNQPLDKNHLGGQLFFEAARKENYTLMHYIQRLCKKNIVNITLRDHQSRRAITPLTVAISSHRAGRVKVLLLLGADVNDKTSTYSPLYCAWEARSLNPTSSNIMIALRAYGAELRSNETQATHKNSLYLYIKDADRPIDIEKATMREHFETTLGKMNPAFQTLNKIIIDYAVPPSADLPEFSIEIGKTWKERPATERMINDYLFSILSKTVADYVYGSSEPSPMEITVLRSSP